MKKLTIEFIDSFPETLEQDVLYISVKFGSAAHLCCCGCGEEVVTPFSPTDWKLIYDGKSITIYPSIGNWNFNCQSHYFITNSTVEWAPKWSRERIEKGRLDDLNSKKQYFSD